MFIHALKQEFYLIFKNTQIYIMFVLFILIIYTTYQKNYLFGSLNQSIHIVETLLTNASIDNDSLNNVAYNLGYKYSLAKNLRITFNKFIPFNILILYYIGIYIGIIDINSRTNKLKRVYKSLKSILISKVLVVLSITFILLVLLSATIIYANFIQRRYMSILHQKDIFDIFIIKSDGMLLPFLIGIFLYIFLHIIFSLFITLLLKNSSLIGGVFGIVYVSNSFGSDVPFMGAITKIIAKIQDFFYFFVSNIYYNLDTIPVFEGALGMKKTPVISLNIAILGLLFQLYICYVILIKTDKYLMKRRF